MSELWGLLEGKLPISNINTLTDAVKQFVWCSLLERTADVQLFVPGPDDVPAATRWASVLGGDGALSRLGPRGWGQAPSVGCCCSYS